MRLVWKKSDFDATMGVFFDGFTKIVIAVGVLLSLLPKEIIFGKVMSGLGVSVLGLHIYYWYLGEKMKKETGDESYVAIPGGVSAYRFFIYLFAIFFVVLGNDTPETALKVTVMANFLGSIVFIFGAWIVPFLMKILPGESIFGALAGAALAFLGINVINGSVVTMPLIGIVSSFIIFIIYLGNIKTKLPAVLIAITFGTILGWIGVFAGFTPESVLSVKALTDSFNTISIYLPSIAIDFLNVEIFKKTLPFLPVIIAFGIGDVVNVILGLGQAKAVGHNYSEKKVIIGTGIFSLLSSFLGNPFPFTIFFGYNTWKEIDAGTGYSLATGMIYLVLGLTGSFAVISSLIPIASVGGILVFIALVSIAQTFASSDTKYYSALSMALIIPVFEVISNMMGKEVLNLAPNLLPLAQGSTITAILWTAGLVFIIDNKWLASSSVFLTAALASFIGLIHSGNIMLFANVQYTIIYIIIAVILAVLNFTHKSEVK
ncbi:MAG: hypothetical protein ACRCVG_08120 [Methanobacteriaceae archaeon]